MVKKTLNILRQRLSFYDNSLVGRLNLAGTTIFYTIAIAVALFEKQRMQGDLFRILIFGLFYSIGTLDVNHVVLPYRVRRPYTIYVSKGVALRHLLFTILYGFTPQLLIFSLFDFLLIIFGIYDIAVLLLLCVVLLYLSKLTSGIGLLTSSFFIFGAGYGIYYNSFYLSFLSLILGYSIVWIIISVHFFYPSSKIEMLFRSFENPQFKPRSIYAQVLHLLNRAKFTVILFVACLSFMGYWAQFFVYKELKVPFMLLIDTLFITIIEIIVGNNSSELSIDSSRMALFNVNEQMPVLKKFLNSSYYFYSLLVFLVGLAFTPGILIYTGIDNVFVLHIVLLPLVFFIGFVYYRKGESLVNGESNRIFKFSLPLLYLLITTAVVMVRGK